jgi:hypothetical protein
MESLPRVVYLRVVFLTGEPPMRSGLLTLMTVAAAIAVIGVTTPVAAGDDLVKSATLTLKGWKVAFIGSAGQSKGELTYQGKTRKFKMTGLGIGGVGISASEATGVVYNMKSMDDFTGSYTSARSGVTVGDAEILKDKMFWLKNEKGVRIELKTSKDGLELNLGVDGTVIQWDD